MKTHKMSDLPPLPPDDLTELEKEAWTEFEAQLDDYIKQWKAEVGKFLEERRATSVHRQDGVSDDNIGRSAGVCFWG